MTSKFVGPYFKIAKAIKIFDNKIDEHDLLNYAITGKIELSVFIPEFKTLIWCPCLTKDMRDWLLNTGFSGHRITLGSSSIEKDIGFFELHYDNNSNPDGAEWVRGLDTNIGNQCLFPGIAGGVWRIPPASALELLKNDSVQIPVGELLQADYFDSIYELFDPKKMVKINPNHKISSVKVNMNKIIITKKQMYKLDELLNPAPSTTNSPHGNKISHANRRIAAIHAIVQILIAYHNEIFDDKDEVNDIALLSKVKEDWGRIHGNKVKILNDKTLMEIIKELQERPDESQSIYIKPKQDQGK
ncbi:hypothetical protein ABGY98_001678 [Salmonella enterica]|uniref:Uncharacterized protein n=1 Tax=Salmonella enterica subsp. diarizonae serovar 48:i:z TaxID=1192842 RepID=A0A7U5YEV7_SALDZ|nr:hypothetical protein [Salmonella enterica]EAA4450845.1 hypothetical protein [Salmonella enterica subsp. diarizonae]AXC71661.1 hypothetical protein DOE59_08715 [Salmonella enterica subsp. diarizonae serovar 48:i:z]EAM6404749.1 hypothetical protein [Salmonella enterica]EAN2410797.1 hypothetical protein [Salmonella enterica]EAP0948535.1 hypothetical protein [Salmonella enterica]